MALLVTKSTKAAYAVSPLSGHWLRGVDLNSSPALIPRNLLILQQAKTTQ
jgi:hypothetical protein